MTKIMAHRGARNLWAENSLTGFRNVLNLAVEAAEFDIHLTQEGQILVIHDVTLERTTTGSGEVRELNDERRRSVLLKNEQGEITDDHIPTLEEVLDIFEGHPEKRLYIELKSGPGGIPYDGLVEKAVEIIRSRKMSNNVALHSFDRSVVARCEEVAPEIERLISLNTDWLNRHGSLEQFFADVEPLVNIVGVHHELFEAEFERITKLFPKDRLGVWTLNDSRLIDHWMQRGVGYITSDRPDLVIRSRAEIASSRVPFVLGTSR